MVHVSESASGQAQFNAMCAQDCRCWETQIFSPGLSLLRMHVWGKLDKHTTLGKWSLLRMYVPVHSFYTWKGVKLNYKFCSDYLQRTEKQPMCSVRLIGMLLKTVNLYSARVHYMYIDTIIYIMYTQYTYIHICIMYM